MDQPSHYCEPTENGKFRCTLCPRACVLHDGQRGFCFVRQATASGIVLSTYGRASGFCVDPIEKKPLYHFYPGSDVLSFGTVGCNLGCKFCQNWDLSRATELDRSQEIASPKQVARAAVESHSTSVAFTYNDPIIFAEYAIDSAIECHNLGIKTVAVTNGYVAKGAREDFFSVMDATNVDLKAFTEDFYKKLCSGSLRPVLDTLSYLAQKTSVWLEVTTLIIPGENDSAEELEAMSKWYVQELGPKVPWHFSAFHSAYKLNGIGGTPTATLLRARDIALQAGIRHVYTGNCHHPQSQATYCENCNNLLIERHGYRLGQYAINAQGRCRKCGELVPGRFAEQ